MGIVSHQVEANFSTQTMNSSFLLLSMEAELIPVVGNSFVVDARYILSTLVSFRERISQGSATAEMAFISSSRVCLTTPRTAGIKGCVSVQMPRPFRDITCSWQINPLSHSSKTVLFPSFL